MADVTGRIGDADVQLDNAATEATLRQLLQSIQRLSTVLGSARGNNTSGNGQTPQQRQAAQQLLLAQQQQAAASTGVAKAAGPMGVAFGVLGGILGDLAASAFKTVGNLTDFAGKLLDGTASVSGIFAAFKDLPFGLGAVAGLFEKLAKITEENLNAFRQLSKVGVNLGGDLNQIRVVASSVGLSMQEYGEVISANSETIALLGKSADDGAAAFTKINKGLTTGNLSNQLLSLGYGFRDINELTASYIKINGGLTASQLKNTSQVQQSVINYGKELDVLARLTGKSREQLQKEQEEQANDLNFQSYLNGLDADEREKANAALQLAMQSGGKGAADALKAKLMGLPPLTEEAQMYVASMQAGGKSIEDFAEIVKNGKTLQQSQNQLDKVFSQAVSGNIKDLKQFRTVLAAGGMTGDKFSSTLQTVQAAVATYMKRDGDNMTEEAAIQRALNDERKKQIEQGKSGAAQAAESERALKALSAELIGAMLPVFKVLTPIVQDLAQKFIGFAKDNMPMITDVLTKFVTAVAEFLKDLFSPGGVDRTMKKIENYVELLVGKLTDMILRKLNPLSFLDTPNAQKRDATSEEISENLQQQGTMGFAEGGIANGPTTGYKTLLHGPEAVVPLPDGRKIPVKLDMKMPDIASMLPDNIQSMITELQKTVQPQAENYLNKIKTAGSDMMKDISNTAVKQAADLNISGSKDLLTELQLLNKNIATLITHSKTNVDVSRSNLDAIKGLNSNLFA
jgi:hypothetical protein